MSETYKKIYRLKEFNIFRESADDYLLAAVDGTQIALDANGARFFFLLESTPVDEMDALLATHGLPQPDHGLLYELIAAGFLQIVEEKIDPPFDVERALKNVEKPNLGPLTLQELAITLSDACPLNCSYCFRKNDGAKGKLDHETVERVL
jgi:sulfatase maturation enzyme AslB (radical SAM superfamily)